MGWRKLGHLMNACCGNHVFTLLGYLLPICSTRPCGVEAGMCFSIIPAGFRCEVRGCLGD